MTRILWWMCWAFVFAVVAFDIVFSVNHSGDMDLIEGNPVQSFIITYGGIWSAVTLRAMTVLVIWYIAMLTKQSSWFITRLMVLVHIWLVVSYVAFLWIMNIELETLFLDNQWYQHKI